MLVFVSGQGALLVERLVALVAVEDLSLRCQPDASPLNAVAGEARRRAAAGLPRHRPVLPLFRPRRQRLLQGSFSGRSQLGVLEEFQAFQISNFN